MVQRNKEPSFVAHKWKDKIFSQVITCADSITANVFQMKQYFSGIRLKADSGYMWLAIHTGHDKVYKAIKTTQDGG